MLGCESNKKAFSLLEIVVAVGILSVGIVSVMQAFSFSAKAAGLSGEIVRAEFLAQDKMQEWEFKESRGWLAQEPPQAQGVSGKFQWKYDLNFDNSLQLYKLNLGIFWQRSGRKEEISIDTYLR